MKARILQFPKEKIMKHKQINAELLKLMMRHHKLIAAKRKRGFSAEAIAKTVLAAESSRR